jgi:hypothetical protein
MIEGIPESIKEMVNSGLRQELDAADLLGKRQGENDGAEDLGQDHKKMKLEMLLKPAERLVYSALDEIPKEVKEQYFVGLR